MNQHIAVYTRRICFFRTAAVVLLRFIGVLALLFGWFTPQYSSQASAPLQSHLEEVQANDFLLILSPPANITPEMIPVKINREQSQRLAKDLLKQHAQPVLTQLNDLRVQGLIDSYSMQPDKFGILVKIKDPKALDLLRGMKEIVQVASSAQPAPACSIKSAASLTEQVYAMSSVGRISPAAPEQAQPSRSILRGSTAAVKNYIDIYLPIGSSYSIVEGYVASNAAVVMELRRGGVLIATQTTKSRADGFFSIFPSWDSCPNFGPSYTIQAGDEVTVQAGGVRYQTTVVDLTAWGDPTTDLVSGSTRPGQAMQIMLYRPQSGTSCSYVPELKTIQADSQGSFSAKFNDFNGRAWANVFAMDGNGNSTYTYVDAYYVYADDTLDWFGIHLGPNTLLSASLVRGAQKLESISELTDRWGDFYYSWEVGAKPGDQVQVTSGAVKLTLALESLTTSANPIANTITGHSVANRDIFARVANGRPWNYLTSCNSGDYCTTAVTNSSGDYKINISNGLQRGDNFNITSYQPNGNYLYTTENYIPLMGVHLTNNAVTGTWSTSAAQVTITQKSSNGTVIEKLTADVDSWYGDYDGILTKPITAGQKISVSDGTTTLTETIGNFTARVYTGTDKVTGVAPGGLMIMGLLEYNNSDSVDNLTCLSANVNGSFSLNTGKTFVPQSQVIFSLRDGNENFLVRFAQTLSLTIVKDSDYIFGSTDKPGGKLTLLHTHNGVKSAPYTFTTPSNGWFFTNLSKFESPDILFTQGDTLQVTTDEGKVVKISIPVLSSKIDAANNRVTVKGPANSNIRLILWRIFGRDRNSYSESFPLKTNSSGDASMSLKGLKWDYVCRPVDTNDKCLQTGLEYLTPEGHIIKKNSASPQAIAKDKYEPMDDNSAGAPLYTGPSRHSLTIDYSVSPELIDEDWVKFNVPQEAVDEGTPIQILLSDTGWYMEFSIQVFDTDGSTPIDSPQIYRPDETLPVRYVFDKTGPYYVRITPASFESAGGCDSAYTLTIAPINTQIFVPLISW